jgi:hypothetical protein
MPFKSKKQKKTIDAAAHNPTFAKKVGIKVGDAKRMSAHGKGQTKFQEATDTVEKDEKGNVKSWKHEGDWKKADTKQGRGKVTNLSDKARRKTAKMSKAETEMAEAFEKAMEGSIRGGVWTSQPPDKGQKDVPPPQEVDGGILNKKQPKPVNSPRPVKKAETNPTSVDDQPATDVAESKKKPSKIKTAMKNNKAKALKENIKLVYQLLAEAKKSGKCTCSTNEDTCKVHGDMKEGLKGGQKKLDVAPPKGKITGADFKALKGKKKNEKTDEAIDQNDDGKNDFKDVQIARLKAAANSKSKKVKEGAMSDLDADKKEKQYKGTQAYHAKKKAEKEKTDKKKVDEGKDTYMESLYQKLNNQLNG